MRSASSAGSASPPSSTARSPDGRGASPERTSSSIALHSDGTPPNDTRSCPEMASSSAPGSLTVSSGSTHTGSPRSSGGNSCRTCASKLSRDTSGSAKPSAPSTVSSNQAR